MGGDHIIKCYARPIPSRVLMHRTSSFALVVEDEWLPRMDIADARWQRAMDAIRSAIRVTGTKEYVRFYQREVPTGPWRAVTIDLAAA